ncbi:hypothetical protein NEPTK9_000968 [Candidatus Neptunochlamydia vexilliferae]|uniref:Transposase n=1 Tax=Candidatus Neptunichlamydia vexilliferae TaxID=1651774 RepID=A0ABS0AZS7_9BACT|nr:hypothetical protein [Candidatus Neptunochlamydia vexilliferae]
MFMVRMLIFYHNLVKLFFIEGLNAYEKFFIEKIPKLFTAGKPRVKKILTKRVLFINNLLINWFLI